MKSDLSLAPPPQQTVAVFFYVAVYILVQRKRDLGLLLVAFAHILALVFLQSGRVSVNELDVLRHFHLPCPDQAPPTRTTEVKTSTALITFGKTLPVISTFYFFQALSRGNELLQSL